MQVKFSPEAELELQEAFDWYELQSTGLGFEFARAVESAVNLISRNPLVYPKIEADFRRILLRKFPFMLVYVELNSTLLVISCFHQMRKPKSWV